MIIIRTLIQNCNEDRVYQRKGLPLTEEDKSLNLNNFNLVDGWWLDRKKEILSSLNPARVAQLSIEMTQSGLQKTPIGTLIYFVG